MRTTLNIDKQLLREAMDAAGTRYKTETIHLGLKALIRRRAASRLASLGGTAPEAEAAPRRKPWDEKNIRDSVSHPLP